MGAADGGFDAVAVVLLQHAEVFVAELVGDVFDVVPQVLADVGGLRRSAGPKATRPRASSLVRSSALTRPGSSSPAESSNTWTSSLL